MRNDEHIVSYTAAELAAMRARGESMTDWARLDAMTEEQLEASIDWEEEGEPDWDTTRPGLPGPHQRLTMLIDDDIIAWFRAEVEGTGLGFKTRMNDALRDYMGARQKESVLVETGSTRRAS